MSNNRKDSWVELLSTGKEGASKESCDRKNVKPASVPAVDPRKNDPRYILEL